ncbi:MAG TPA: 16S rRNA (guanine(527)-N(7))-methyltransferase RsmG [Candidatus Acidoferrales bacterium]|nr:16S rRNA (guanine(527)-N(7))-methyltransferase RsmG [Candidatus Acidoferrales bacterium]
MNPLPVDEIQRTLRTYGFSASPTYCEQVRLYVELLLRWNRKVSLTAVTELREILKFHFGESLLGIEAAAIENGRLADLGSGAGFPGIPIAMAKPGLEAALIESNAKKAAFLEEVRRELDLKNISVHKGRIEELPASEKFTFVTARALGRHRELLGWTRKRLLEGGRAVLWLSSAGFVEVKGVPEWDWREPVQIPGTKERFVAVGQPGRSSQAGEIVSRETIL